MPRISVPSSGILFHSRCEQSILAPKATVKSSGGGCLMGIARRIRVARGEEAGDLILRGGQLVNVCSGEIYPADVVIAEGTIAAIGEPGQYDAREAHDLGGRFLVPGLIDGH